MYVLQAHWQPSRKPAGTGAVLFWAETYPPAGVKAGGEKRWPRDHPFRADAADLRTLLGRAEARTETFTLRLPSDTKGPLPSLRHEVSQGSSRKRKPKLRAWNVPGLRLTPDEAFGVLLAWLEEDRAPPDVRIGDSLRYWQRAAQLALGALARQRMVPGVKRLEDGNLYARWLPLLDGLLLDRLSEAMPPVCRAAAGETRGPGALLKDFLEETCDALARAWSVAREEPVRDPSEPGSRWVGALFGPPAPIGGSAAQQASLERSHHLWLRALKLAGDEHFRVALQLSAPDGIKEDDWSLSFALQARDDPSLLVRAADVWQARDALLGVRRLKEPREKLLAGLGYAARFFEPVERALKSSSTPDSLSLTADEAFHFLRDCAPLLEESGFGVLVPPWWHRSGARLGLRARVSPKTSDGVSQGMMSLEKLVNYRWELALGGHALSKEEFETLVSLKSPLVQLRGEWVQLDPEQVNAALKFFARRNQQSSEIELSEALRLGLGGTEEIEGLQVEEVSFEGWLETWFDRLGDDGRKLEPLPVPADLRAELRPYQHTGYAWLNFLRGAGLGACLADDMGLGKCVSAGTLVPVNGTLRRAEDIWQVHAGEAAFDGEGYWAEPTKPLLANAMDEATGRIVQAPIRRLYRQWVRESLRTVRLEDGSSITITRRHRLLTDKGWTNELRADDYVCVPAKAVWEEQPEDPDLVRLLAWQMAEGYERQDRATLSISQKDVERLEDLLKVLRRIGRRYGLKINNPAVRTPTDRVPALVVNSKAYRQFLEAKGYLWGRRSREKEIPPFVMQAERDTARLFLRHYFEAEASVVSSMRSVEISTASPLLIQQLSLLLRRFGIWLRVSEKRKCATNGSGTYRTYSIGTLGGNAARKFLREIGFDGPKKQRKLEQICEAQCNTNVEGIPASNVVAEAVVETGLPVRHLGMRNTVYTNGSRQFSRSSLERVVAAVDRVLSGEAEQQYRQIEPSRWTSQTLEAYENLDARRLKATRRQLRRLLEGEVFFCKVEHVEEAPYEGWVYDFEVDEHHNFVANNILCHNTIQTLALLSRDQEQGQLRGPVLLVCPTSVVNNWQKEAERFTPGLRCMVHQGPNRPRGEEFVEQLRQTDLVLTSYALLRRDAEVLQSVAWYGVILDEAQNIKNPEALQSKLVYSLRSGFRLALTGTPVENRLGELWAIMRFLNPGYLGSRQDFRRRFARPIERERDEEAVGSLHRLTSPLVLRRLKTDPKVIQDLPEKQETKEYCQLGEEQASLYEAVIRDAMTDLEDSEGIQRKGLVLAMLIKLKQICNHPAQFLHEASGANGEVRRSGKLIRLIELLEETSSIGDRSLIFTQYREMGSLMRTTLSERFGDPTVQFIHGGTSAKRRAEMVRRFQEDEEGPTLFILSLKAGGTGLNLTRANHVFHFDRWWNPAVEDQATDRAFRIGQTRNVQVHKFVCVGTLEEKIDEMIEQKKSLAESVLGAGENWLTEFSDQDLRELVKLRREVMA